MASTESGWTDKYPHKADAGDEYYFVRRKDRDEVVVMGFSMGKAWLNGVSYEPSELRSHLFLGPLKPSDAEELMELRKLLLDIQTVLLGPDGPSGRNLFALPISVEERLRASLSPSQAKERKTNHE